MRGPIAIALSVLCLSFAACATASPAAPPSTPTQATKALSGTLSSGAGYVIPNGWWHSTAQPGVMRLQDPERTMHLWLVEVTGPAGKAAIDTAWKRVGKDVATLAVKQIVTPPSRTGWDAVTHVAYEPRNSGEQASVAVGFRHKAMSYVILIDGPTATLAKRGAQIRTVMGGLKAPGAKPEHFASKTAHALDKARLARFDRFVATSMKDAKIPGAAVAVVQDGKVVFAKGYGVRELGKDAPVTAETPFMIGSTTKSMTSLMIAKLADEGLLSWDTPLPTLMPTFSVGDADFAKRITMRHSMCACTGLPRQDMEMLFEFGAATPAKRLEELAKMKPTTGFGETFQYSNPLVSAGGYAAAAAAYPKLPLSEAYAKVMNSRVFGPLGMTQTTFDMPAVIKDGRHATPHGITVDGSYEPLPLSVERAVLSVAPAGGAWSTVGDLARLMIMEMEEGLVPGGTRAFGRSNLLQRRKPGIRVSDSTHYGLALMRVERYGLTSVGHGGATLGFSTTWVFYPKARLGIVVLSNAQAAGTFNHFVHRRLLEIVYDGKEQAREDLAHALSTRSKGLALRRKGIVADPEWNKQVVGAWRNPALGPMTVSVEGDALLVDAGEWKTAAGRQLAADGSASLMLTGPPLQGVKFLHDPAAGTLTLKTSQRDYIFKRQP